MAKAAVGYYYKDERLVLHRVLYPKVHVNGFEKKKDERTRAERLMVCYGISVYPTK